MHPRLACAALALVSGLCSAPADAEPPPLIPRATLFGNPARDQPSLSPDGTRLAYLRPSEAGVMNIWIRTLGRDDDRMLTSDTRQGIWGYAWAWDGEHLLYLQDRDGDENLHLWCTEVEDREVRDLTPFQGARATNLLTSPARPHEVLVGLNRRDPRLFDMHRIDLRTGAVVLDTENPGDVLGWTTDADFVIRAASAFDPVDGRTVLRVRDAAGAPWRDLVVSPFADTHLLGQVNGGSLVLGWSPDGRSLYAALALDSDKTRLVELDAATGRRLAVRAEDPRCDLAAGWGADAVPRFQVQIHPRTQALEAALFTDLEPRWTVLDRALEPDFAALARVRRGACAVVGRDRDDRRWVVHYDAPDAPGAYYLYDRAARRAELLFEQFPPLAAQRLAPPRLERIRARDGLVLPSYLTLPVGVPARRLPFVLLVHGGPWARDGFGYDPAVQWLANRGYGVLQVQFRGSIGFGKQFVNASNGEWGGRMQDDLTDAVRWAVDQGLADPRRIGILGGSYGGYAVLAGLAFTPELYACGVDIVGPSNVATALAAVPAYWGPVKKRWQLRVGDVENDAELNRRISPLFHVERMRAPLLIGHGANDPRVELAESEQIVAALRARGLPVTFVVYPDEGHGFGRPENNLDFFGRAEEFLAQHLGGRAEPWQAVPGSSAEAR
jgi:dipeptidyl aminopeptidase/acylaminoacyl peptidase